MRGLSGNAGTIFFEELRRSVFRRSFVLVTTSVPVILVWIVIVIVVVRAMTGTDDTGSTLRVDAPKPIGIVNLAPELNILFGDVPEIVRVPTRHDAIDAILQESLRDAFVVPVDYVQSGTIEWVNTGGSFSQGFDTGPDDETGLMIRNLLRVSLVGEHLPDDVLVRSLAPAAFQRTQVAETGRPVEERDEDLDFTRFLVAFVAAILMMVSILFGGSSLMQSVSEEKENRMIEILLTSARPISIMAGKVLAVGSAGLFQMMVWVASLLTALPIIFDTLPNAPELKFNPLVIVWALAFFVAGYFIAAVLLAGIGAATTGFKEASQFSAMVLLPVAAPFWFVGVIIGDPTGALARVLSFVPLTAPITMLIRIAAADPSIVEIVSSLAVNVAAGWGLLLVVARVFRAGTLMYGQRMGLRTILTALREAG